MPDGLLYGVDTGLDLNPRVGPVELRQRPGRRVDAILADEVVW